jgi:predicted O-methyltransferase YrrM
MESWISDLGLQKSVADSRIAIVSQYSLSVARKSNRPYFGQQLSAFQSPPVRYAVMADLTRYAFRGKTEARVLEVGSWAGASAITFGTVIKEMGISDSKIICIDQWAKYFVSEDNSLHYMNMSAATLTGEIQRLFQHNVRACGLEEMVQVKKASSREALPELKSEAFDLVYIDGSHKKDDVLYDLQQAKRLVRNGGVICGDDIELMKDQIDLDAHNVALEKNTDFVVDPRTGVSYHPGVTEAIAGMFDNVWQEHGLWCVKRSDDKWSVPDFRAGDLEIPTHLQHAVEIPYGVLKGYEFFQLGEGFVAYPMADEHWFQNRIVASSIEELVLLLEAIEHIDQVRGPRIVESRSGFNIVNYEGKSWVVDQSVGSVDFRDKEQLKQLAACCQILEMETIGEARAAIDRIRMDEVSAPHLIASRSGFNILHYKGKNWVVDQAVGNVNFQSQEQLNHLAAIGVLLEVENIGEAREAIHRMFNAKANIAASKTDSLTTEG